MMTIANVEMAEAWDGDEGEHWTRYADHYEQTAEPHLRALLAAAQICEDDRLLDLGCGTGKSTRDAARTAAHGSALGVDLSAAMLDHARKVSRREGVSNVAFEQADAQVHPFPDGAFDLVISSFGAMFFGDPVAAFANVCRAVRPDGRLALVAWRSLERNEWLSEIRSALAAGRELPSPPIGAPGPFGLADPELTRDVLRSAGFEGVELEELDEPVKLGHDATDAFAFVSTFGITRGLTHDLDDAGRTSALDALRQTIEAHETDDGVLLGSSAWLIKARVGRAGS